MFQIYLLIKLIQIMENKPIPKYKMTPMEAARREEHRILRNLFFDGWLDRNGHSYRYRWEEDYAKGDIAVRLASTKIRIYDCWLPDPDDDDCAIHLLIDEDDLEKRKDWLMLKTCRKL